MEEPQRKCDICKITKAKSLFYRYKYCNRCHIKNYIKNHLLNAHIANKLNLNIDELNYIMEINSDDPKKNEIGEHSKYDDIIGYFTSSIITDEVINNFLNEVI
jgi:hypothetical protein